MSKGNKIRAFFLSKQTTVAVFLVVFFSVGLVGMLLPATNSFFLQLTPLALLLSFVVLALSDESKQHGKLIVYLLFIYITSFAIEVAGVHTGLLFGAYSYGDNLASKLW